MNVVPSGKLGPGDVPGNEVSAVEPVLVEHRLRIRSRRADRCGRPGRRQRQAPGRTGHRGPPEPWMVPLDGEPARPRDLVVHEIRLIDKNVRAYSGTAQQVNPRPGGCGAESTGELTVVESVQLRYRVQAVGSAQVEPAV